MTVNAPAPLPAGRRIHGRYEIVGYLGGGLNGQVYRVIDHHQGQVVALKMMSGTHPVGAWEEAAILTGVRGPFIVPVLNADQDAGVPFIVTDVLEEGSLDEHTVPGVGVEVATAARWVHQACTGVSRIHDHRLLHNDIKPANLFLDEDHNALVGDLGLACLMDANGYGHPGGTPSTMAPEVAAAYLSTATPGTRPTSVASDVYSLGATLYELLAGHILNPGLVHLSQPDDIVRAIITHQPARLMDVAPHVPQGLSQIVMTAVAPGPADRYRNPGEFGAAIANRTRHQRSWDRVPPCTGHTMCFQGTRQGAAVLALCAVPTGSGTRHELQAFRGAGRRRESPWPVVPLGQLPQKLRARMRDLS